MCSDYLRVPSLGGSEVLVYIHVHPKPQKEYSEMMHIFDRNRISDKVFPPRDEINDAKDKQEETSAKLRYKARYKTCTF